MKVKSYYVTKKNLVVKDDSHHTKILDLTTENVSSVIGSLDEQITWNQEEMEAKEEGLYKELVNKLLIATIFQVFFFYIVFASFTHGSTKGMIIGIILSGLLLLSSFIITIVSIIKIRKCQKQIKISEGREILVNLYNNLNGEVANELVDVY